MKNIINSLCEKQNLLFQSPTGTGKTLVTICSALAYAEKNPNVQVLVLTRTNEQINGFIKEIRKINKYPKISKYSILAGRNQFCLNLDDFKKDFEKQGIKKSKFNKHLTKECNDRCKRTNCETHKAMQSPDLSLFAQNKYVNINQRVFQDQREQLGCTCCPHFKIYKKILKKKQKENLKMDIHFPFVSQGYNQQYNLPDIEDMKELFEQQELGCPFYFNKLATRSAKLVFSTYNYLIKQNILGNIKDLFEGEVVVIFDEAHNISEQAEQEQSTKMQQKYWDQLDTTLQQVQRVFNKNNYSSQNLNNLYRNVQDIICKDIQEEANYFMSSLQKKIVEGESTDTESDKSDLDSSSQEQNDKDDDDVEKVSPKFKHVKYIKQVSQEDQKQSKRKFIQNIQFSSQDIYDKINLIIFNNGELPQNSDENLKQIQQYIKDIKQNKDYTIVEMESTFASYQDLRRKEILDFFNNFQGHFLSIKEDCENIQYIFDEKNQKDVKPFCCLFSDKEITKQFQLLNVVDVKQAENFIDRLTKMFTMLQYLKKVIRVYTEKEKKESKSKSDAQRNIFVAENNQIYEANQDDLNNLKKFGEQLKLKYIQKIWFFFYRLIKLRKMYNYSEDPIYLSNHYISLLRGEYSLVPVLQIGCLSASYLFKKIYKKLKISSLILTSGTLEPFELIQKSLDLEFQTYSSPHIINSQTNLFTQFISHYNDQEISFSMKKLENEDNKNNIFYHSQLAIHFITNKFNEYTNQVKQKGGMVIFFKSYSMLQQYYFLIKNYQSNDFRYFVETRDANEFKEIYSQYKQLIQNNRTNCVFLAVNRGKLSEGIDLKDNLCRVVILFGVPYPCFTDPYVVCKRTHAKLYLKEEQWYKKETVKVVNQSAGRCIRYKDDWGCIFFLDSQYYSESNIYKHISKWILDGQKAKVKQTDEWTQHYSEFLSNKAQEYFQKQNF
ncbi:DEAD protein (macronuclear) [Tetrahymena thermophila SB210]|uniref:DEAD protein n=1 Tax=Tetrahymena thermophila (strain SB210) TaxID=312017 RepID=A4VDE6_TETTS|nr:DEAD protein [Tetrahymena thermophila SB210]EDK31550.2 DEAD protein [Tetrahymena thermophila SB210]|eukprot:XP_001470886.2 DEAD protein [Tetrahymena thermophila SB210]